jgi:hypothetical protein
MPSVEHLDTYRWLSGLGSALVVLLAARFHRQTAFQLLLVTGREFLAKLLFGISTGQSFFMSQASLFEPVPIAHLIGGLTGPGMAWLPNPTNRVHRGASGLNE